MENQIINTWQTPYITENWPENGSEHTLHLSCRNATPEISKRIDLPSETSPELQNYKSR